MDIQAKRERILDSLAQFHYFYPNGQATIRRKWEVLTEYEKKPYIDIARLELGYLHYEEGVAIVDKEAELPHNPYPRQKYGKAQQDMVKDGWVKTHPLVEE